MDQELDPETSPLDIVCGALNYAGDAAVRLFHGRGGFLAGWKHVSVDWYKPAIFVTLYEDVESSDGLISELSERLMLDPRVSCLAVQRRYLPGAPVDVVRGALPDRAYEAGLSFILTLDKNQNHSFFPDMAPGREWLREHAEGKSVLNLFAYTCALSVAAVAGGAERVVNLDQSSRSLAVGRENHRLNFDATICRKSTYLAHDLFKSWGRLKRLAPFDIVVLDPPSHQPGGFIASKDYARMLRRLPELLHPEGALILACLNAPELDESFITELFDEHLPDAELAARLPTPQGYQEAEEGWGLKRLVYRTK